MTAEAEAEGEPTPERKRTRKGQRTRERILEAALAQLQEQGYEATTMRGIAAAAGVAVGNAYYYFPSKDHLVQAFYGALRDAHVEAAGPVLAAETDLAARIGGVLRAQIEVAEPYHRLSGHLFRTVADPRSPLNPFSAESEPVRAEATELMAEVLRGSGARVSADLAGELPELLWLLQMAVVLFWIHDGSPERRRTRALIDHAAPLVARLIGLASNPLLRSLRKQVVQLLAVMRAETP